MTTRANLIWQAKTWIGVPAIASGAQRCGTSCLGLLIGVLRELGGFDEMVREAEKYAGLKHPTSPGDLMRRMCSSRHLKVIRPATLTPGNLALFFTKEEPQHIALVTELNVILHASQVKRKVVEHLVPDGWRVAAEFEIVGLDD